MEAVGFVLVVLAVGALFVWQVSRPRARVRIRDGRVELTRGQLGPQVLGVIADVARQDPAERGTIEVRGRRDTLDLQFVGLSEGAAQRLRNVLLLQRDRI